MTIPRLDDAVLADEAARQRLAEASLKSIFYTTSRYQGDAFFKILVSDLAEALDVFYVIAGRIVQEKDGEVCHTIAVWGGDKLIPNITYRLPGTPCQNVANQEMCFHPRNVQTDYPQDVLLVNMGAESYIGMPMVDTEGRTLGILVALDTRPMSEGKRYLALSLLSIFATRGAAELQFLDRERELTQLVEKRTAELRLARDIAEEANRAKSVFLANMSHELRTPLNAILGFSRMMCRDANLTSTQLGNMEIINQSGEHLLKLINDVLEIARIEAGKLQLEISTFDLQILTGEVIDMMHLRAQQKGVHLELDQSWEFPRYIKGDRVRLRQIMVNLIGNAVKFTGHGSVTIRLGIKDNDRQHLHIEVLDTGPGIKEEDQEKLFKPFVQVADGAASGGSGLGLSIVYQFVQLMKGRLSVDSKPGKGSLFRVELPLQAPEQEEIAHLLEDSKRPGEIKGLFPGQAPHRILVAEDQQDNQLLLTRLMNNLGMEVKIANNGEECVQIFQEWKPELIWMDRRMPLLDGLAATRRIRQLPGGERVKIIAVTASAFKEQQEELYDAGMDAYVNKPYRFNEIYDILAKQLGVQYAYCEEAPVSTATIEHSQLSKLAPELRNELRQALESLDREQINTSINKIAVMDRELAHTLTTLADAFDYPPILFALGRVTDPT